MGGDLFVSEDEAPSDKLQKQLLIMSVWKRIANIRLIKNQTGPCEEVAKAAGSGRAQAVTGIGVAGYERQHCDCVTGR